MRIRSNTQAWLTVLILGLTAIAVLPAQAQNRTYNNQRRYAVPAPPSVTFQRQPRWTNVPGTNVRMINSQDRPAYDMFRMGSSYYIYDNNYWYRSNRWNGTYTAINQDAVPVEFNSVPREYWRSYPADWANQNGNGVYNGNYNGNNNGHHYGQYKRHHRGGPQN
jgi:hypothetical protein